MTELRLTRCPICRARLSGDEPLSEPCRRCAGDLSLVRAAERRAELEAAACEDALARGDRAAAVFHARRALRLVDAPERRELLRRAASGS